MCNARERAFHFRRHLWYNPAEYPPDTLEYPRNIRPTTCARGSPSLEYRGHVPRNTHHTRTVHRGKACDTKTFASRVWAT